MITQFTDSTLIKLPCFSLFITKGGWWFRVFGYGLTCKNTTMHRLYFSERYGFTKGVQIKKFFIRLARPIELL
jgi:hypothetical protein